MQITSVDSGKIFKMSETKEFDKQIEYLEAGQRHDLAVHLYLAFLLHQINPLFPHKNWSSWPQKTVADPTIINDYEDNMIDSKHQFDDGPPLQEQDEESEKQEISHNASDLDTGDDSDHKTVFFRPGLGAIKLRNLPRRRVNPKVTLVNEMHALLLRRISRKLRAEGRGCSPIDEDSPVLKNMALQMANRMGHVFDLLKRQRRMNKLAKDEKHFIPADVYRQYFKQNWQDVVTADLKSNNRNQVANLRRLRQVYTRCRGYFKDVAYDYEYDEDDYDDGEAPLFDVENHLRAIEDDSDSPAVPAPLSRLLQERKKIEEHKEQVFIKLWDLAGLACSVSYRQDDHPGVNPKEIIEIKSEGGASRVVRDLEREKDKLLEVTGLWEQYSQ